MVESRILERLEGYSLIQIIIYSCFICWLNDVPMYFVCQIPILQQRCFNRYWTLFHIGLPTVVGEGLIKYSKKILDRSVIIKMCNFWSVFDFLRKYLNKTFTFAVAQLQFFERNLLLCSQNVHVNNVKNHRGHLDPKIC